MPSSGEHMVGVGSVMVAMVVLVVVSLVFLFAVDSTDDGWRRSISAGTKRPNDTVLWSVVQNKTAPTSDFQGRYCYPTAKGSINGTISAYNLTNLLPPDRGGFVRVDSGGVNDGTKMCFTLYNNITNTYLYNITLWGRPITTVPPFL